MRYRSTRGLNDADAAPVTFEQAVMLGLAPDGGLFIPVNIPRLPAGFLQEWRHLDYCQLCMRLFPLFIDDADVDRSDLERIVRSSYAAGQFTHPDVTPVVKLPAVGGKSAMWLLELFHGPTLAFKDVALQFLGNLFEHFLARRNATATNERTRLTVLGATSGDTGGAAIYGLRGKQDIDVFVLHPHGRVSLVQAAQMCTVTDANVHNVAVGGGATFDDCQAVVKAVFGDQQFRRRFNLGAVNSINWARILAQIVYYFHAYFQLARRLDWPVDGSQQVRFVVPTGNFGDILAAFYARQLGLPVGELVVATNANDILHRFLQTGLYAKAECHATISPAMDIQVSSNFERFLWHLVQQAVVEFACLDEQSAAREATLCVGEWMKQLAGEGQQFNIAVPPVGSALAKFSHKLLPLARTYFASHRASDPTTITTIQQVYEASVVAGGDCDHTFVLDPHTAVGVHAAVSVPSQLPTVCLATAHPSKFLAPVMKAVKPNANCDSDIERYALDHPAEHPVPIPAVFVGILDKPQRFLTCNATAQQVQQLIVDNSGVK